jgi:Zn-dependent protease
MLFSLLSSPILLLPFAAAIILAFTVHEFSHAYAAYKLGDNTAEALGRLTLNPVSHVDPLGLLLLFTVGFGWGKPVPFNANNLKDPKWGAAIIGAAGPLSNFLLGGLGIIVLMLFNNFGNLSPNSLLAFFLVMLVQFNAILMLFNLIPVPPLDGSKILFALLPERLSGIKIALMQYGPMALFGVILLDAFSNLNIFGRLFSGFFDFLNKLLI